MKRYLPIVLLSLLLQTGCALSPSQPSSFYVLKVEPPKQAVVVQGLPIRLGFGPLVMPDLLDRPQIVTRTSANQVQISEFQRWGGELNPEVQRVLAQNLMARLNTAYVFFYPWPDEQAVDVKVGVRLFRFDGELENKVVLDGVLSLQDGKATCPETMEQFHIETPSTDPTHAGLVKAMGLSLGTLSDAIAARVGQGRKGC